MVSEKEKSVLLNILRLYRDRPCLWDHSIKAYANKQVRYEAYSELLEIYRSFDDSVTLPLLKKKISNIRTNYLRELKKVIYAKKNGQEYVPTLWYYYEMAFIKDKHRPKDEAGYDDSMLKSDTESEESGTGNEDSAETPDQSKNAVFLEDEYESEQKFSFVTTSTAGSPAPGSSRSNEKSERSSLKAPKRMRERSSRDSSYSTNQRNLEEAACDSFGQSVAVQLKKMYVENALLAQSRIQSILTEIGISDHRQRVAETQLKYSE